MAFGRKARRIAELQGQLERKANELQQLRAQLEQHQATNTGLAGDNRNLRNQLAEHNDANRRLSAELERIRSAEIKAEKLDEQLLLTEQDLANLVKQAKLMASVIFRDVDSALWKLIEPLKTYRSEGDKKFLAITEKIRRSRDLIVKIVAVLGNMGAVVSRELLETRAMADIDRQFELEISANFKRIFNHPGEGIGHFSQFGDYLNTVNRTYRIDNDIPIESLKKSILEGNSIDKINNMLEWNLRSIIGLLAELKESLEFLDYELPELVSIKVAEEISNERARAGYRNTQAFGSQEHTEKTKERRRVLIEFQKTLNEKVVKLLQIMINGIRKNERFFGELANSRYDAVYRVEKAFGITLNDQTEDAFRSLRKLSRR